MKYRELLERLGQLTDEQLDQPAVFQGDGTVGGQVKDLWIAEEDYVNPSGEGAEPASVYVGQDGIDLNDVVIESGTVLMSAAE